MSNVLKVGNIVDGRVINVKPYGAFVSIGSDKKGLVHISHISNDFVKDINEFLHQGDVVKVKILSMDDDGGKIALSLKDANSELKIEQTSQEDIKEDKVIEVHHKSFATSNDRAANDEKKTKTLEELLKEYNKQANDRQVDINKRLKR
ncbi:MAG: S1 RNA-binding domain-containing protein [Peptoanaerobacter stomatis]|uniref:S1 RNA-binding domain-containing protein n=1 Tax=Peptoanaerobacter stomatis TaxID=796937 RepID=UPI003F9F0A3C